VSWVADLNPGPSAYEAEVLSNLVRGSTRD